MTPEQRREYAKQYYKANKEKMKEQSRAAYFKNHEDNKKKRREKAIDHSEAYSKWGRGYRIRKDYGITEEEYEARIAAQGCKCAICQEPLDNPKTTHLDHNHETGQLRGVLCISCNHGLGKFKDRTDLLEAAIEYLNSHAMH